MVMSSEVDSNHWWASAHFQITHPSCDLSEIAKYVRASDSVVAFAALPETKFGMNKGKFFWSSDLKVKSPVRPNELIAWAERTALENEKLLIDLVTLGSSIYVYVGIHSNVLSLGFDLPQTPTLLKLGIAVGLEYFSP